MQAQQFHPRIRISLEFTLGSTLFAPIQLV